ncbi:MoaD/ThiS family protein [Flavobacteriales bacterium]|jgi:molybdopterin converting factor small subunit|nr:MoaD/ThiS family protein [Flavobacteriales bacterium]MDB2317357.1 MoaD/ThiS family protein [Flavobacteriales bacterium]
MAKVIIPTPLRKFTDNQAAFEADAANVYEAIEALASAFPTVHKHLFDDKNQIRSFLRIYLGDEDINVLDKEKTALKADDVLSIIPAIAGGIN